MKIIHYIPSIDRMAGGTSTYMQMLSKDFRIFTTADGFTASGCCACSGCVNCSRSGVEGCSGIWQ